MQLATEILPYIWKARLRESLGLPQGDLIGAVIHPKYFSKHLLPARCCHHNGSWVPMLKKRRLSLTSSNFILTEKTDVYYLCKRWFHHSCVVPVEIHGVTSEPEAGDPMQSWRPGEVAHVLRITGSKREGESMSRRRTSKHKDPEAELVRAWKEDLYQGADVSCRSTPFDADCQALPLL